MAVLYGSISPANLQYQVSRLTELWKIKRQATTALILLTEVHDYRSHHKNIATYTLHKGESRC